MGDTVQESEEGTIVRNVLPTDAMAPDALGGDDELNPLQMYGLGLLERVMAVRKSYEDDPSKDDWMMNALNRAVYAAYLDCVDEGVGESAKALLRQGAEE